MMNKTSKKHIIIICPFAPAFFITIPTFFCTKSSLFFVLSISVPSSSIILSCTTHPIERKFEVSHLCQILKLLYLSFSHVTYLRNEFIMYSKPHSSNPLYTFTQLIQFFVLLPEVPHKKLISSYSTTLFEQNYSTNSSSSKRHCNLIKQRRDFKVMYRNNERDFFYFINSICLSDSECTNPSSSLPPY